MARGGRLGCFRMEAFMRNVGLVNILPVWQKSLLALVIAFAAGISAAPAETSSLEDLVSAVVRIKTTINPDGRTVDALGREREGSGIVIDSDGLVLTIGYLMVEAQAAEIITNSGKTLPATLVG